MRSERSLDRDIAKAVRYFWKARLGQAKKQEDSGLRDQGSRGAVTGGKQLDGFVSLVRKTLTDCGLPDDCIHIDARLELPGYFRPEKKWDLLAIKDDVLLAAVEFKSQVGPSFGNNFNNRSEEAIGTAQDIWTAYREGAFSAAHRPWVGYLLLLEDCPKSTSPVSVRQPHFPVLQEFIGASYSQRYQLLMNKLIRERLYDSACFLLSPHSNGSQGRYSTPDSGLSFSQFTASLAATVSAFLAAREN